MDSRLVFGSDTKKRKLLKATNGKKSWKVLIVKVLKRHDTKKKKKKDDNYSSQRFRHKLNRKYLPKRFTAMNIKIVMKETSEIEQKFLTGFNLTRKKPIRPV